MEPKNIFITKTGFCHILPNTIILTKYGNSDSVPAVPIKNYIIRVLAFYGVLSIVFMVNAYVSFQSGEIMFALLFIVIALYLIYSIVISRNNSTTSVIEINKIKKVIFKKGLYGITRSRFQIIFEDENSQLIKRIIMLPGSMNNGPTESQKALKIFKKIGLM